MAAEIYVSNARGRRASRAIIVLGADEDIAKRRRPSLVVDGLSIVNVIRKKRDSEELSDDEIEWFVASATNRRITEAQIGTSAKVAFVKRKRNVTYSPSRATRPIERR